MKLRKLLLFSTLCIQSLLCGLTDQEIIQKYLIDYQRPVTKLILDVQCRRGLLPTGCQPYCPDYYIKYGIERIKSADLSYNVIRDKNLNLLFVPQKFLYHIPGKPDDLTDDYDDHYYIVAERVMNLTDQIMLNKQQVQQLVMFMRETDFADAHPDNVCVMSDGRVAIIDLGEILKETVDRMNAYLGIINLLNGFTFDAEATFELLELIDTFWGLSYFYTDYKRDIEVRRCDGKPDTLFIKELERRVHQKK